MCVQDRGRDAVCRSDELNANLITFKMVKTLYLFQRAWSRISAKKKVYFLKSIKCFIEINLIFIFIFERTVKFEKLNCKNVKMKLYININTCTCT